MNLRRAPLAALLLLPMCVSASQLIQNALVVDGSGAAARSAAVRIHEGKIEAVGELAARPGEEIVDAGGKVLAPGFIDSHSHHDGGIFERRDTPEAVSQGITTIVIGQDGDSQFPLADFYRRLQRSPASVNVASYVGHAPLRAAVMGRDYQRPATAKELAAMRRLLAREMKSGAIGLSTGLEYDPGTYAKTDELVELAREAARFGGRYISHMRSEDLQLDDAIEELLSIGRTVCLPVQISHFKLAIRSRWGNAPEVLRRLDSARAGGIDVTADVYPYEYWQSTLTVLFPDRNFGDRATAEAALRDIAAPEDLIMSEFEPEPALVGKSVAEIAKLRGADAAATLINLIREAQSFGKEGGNETVIGKSMNEQDIAQLIAWPHTNISSDGAMHDAHPRGAGAFTRVLRVLVREQKRLTLEQAIHKMTGLTAAHMGLKDRGVIQPGAVADLVLLDPQTVADRAEIGHPERLSTGIERVWVNGRTVWQEGRTTQVFAGQALRRADRALPFTCESARD